MQEKRQSSWETEPDWPICLRCGREFENRMIEETNPGGNPEIACKDWCPDCNRLVMMTVFREQSAYYKKGGLYDPIRGGSKCQSESVS